MYDSRKRSAFYGIFDMPRKKVGHDSLTIQIPESLARIVRRLAKEEGRHLSKMVEILIREGLSKREQQVSQGSLFNSAHNMNTGS